MRPNVSSVASSNVSVVSSTMSWYYIVNSRDSMTMWGLLCRESCYHRACTSLTMKNQYGQEVCSMSTGRWKRLDVRTRDTYHILRSTWYIMVRSAIRYTSIYRRDTGRVFVWHLPACMVPLCLFIHAGLVYRYDVPGRLFSFVFFEFVLQRAIEVSHAACKDECRKNPRSHSWRFPIFFYNSTTGLN